jgi:hypothetical protein
MVGKMEEKVIHYAVIGTGRSLTNPSGLARRRYTNKGRVDEALQRDLTWASTSAITQWEYGNLSGELTEIGEEDARKIVEKFREKWGTSSG